MLRVLLILIRYVAVDILCQEEKRRGSIQKNSLAVFQKSSQNQEKKSIPTQSAMRAWWQDKTQK